jgi:hypothetical protein
LRRYLLTAAQEFASCAVVHHFITGEFPKHPRDIVQLSDDDGRWWPLNPYTGEKIKIFTPADGTLEEVFGGNAPYGDIYWEYWMDDAGVEWARMSMKFPWWDEGERLRRFSVGSAWSDPLIGATVFQLTISSESVKEHRLYEMKMREGVPDPYAPVASQ